MELHNLLQNESFLSRPPHYRAGRNDLDAMRRLTHVFAEGEEVILQELVNAAVAFTGADSAGISLLESPDGTTLQFRWVAVVGTFAQYLHGTTPRFFSPCGTCLDRKQPQLYRVTKPYYEYLGIEAEPINEGILIPWENEFHRGTFWIVSHAQGLVFDINDYNLLSTLADFASLAISHHFREKHVLVKEKSAASAAMANDLAHQINNPLQGLTNALYLAQQGGKKSGEYVDQAVAELTQVSALVGRLLTLNRQ